MENKATEGVNLKQNMEDSVQSHDEETFSIEKTVEGLLNESVGKFTENLENLENPYSNTLENTSDTLVDTNDTLVDHSDTLEENPDDDELDEVPGDNNFNDIIDKVDYITDKNFNELVNILMNDNALSTMLIDMINRNKYGNKYPSIMTKIQMIQKVQKHSCIQILIVVMNQNITTKMIMKMIAKERGFVQFLKNLNIRIPFVEAY